MRVRVYHAKPCGCHLCSEFGLGACKLADTTDARTYVSIG